VEYAEPNWLLHALLTPNDPALGKQWGLHNTGQTGGVPDSDIDAPEAWDRETGDPSVVLALLDTGVDLDHPDLAGRVLIGHDFVNDDDEAQDDHGHGTFMAGILGALSDNGIGIAGVSWYGQILPVKVMDNTGTGTHADVADGVVYATDNGSDVINLSLGDATSSATLENAIRYAFDRGVVLVAGVGNDNGPVLYPAAYDEVVLGVAATDHHDVRAAFSNVGPEVDVAAPGVDIYSTHWDNTYATKSGTSAATAFVSGLAGLLRSHDPTLTPDQVMTQLKATAQDVNQASLPGEDDALGAGRINAANALTMALAPAQEALVHATITYAYDANGNQVQQTIHKANGNPSEFAYAYDAENRLTQITYPDGSSSAYAYDGLGKRIEAVEDGELTRYLYDGLSAILERDATGQTTAYYTRGLGYGGGIGSIISRQSTVHAPQYFHYDGLGSVTGLTDPTAKLLQTTTYDAFGNVLEQQGAAETPYGFSTKEVSPTSGLVYFGARYYDPRIGRFLTQDPLGMVDGPNLYVYAGNNPISFFDPYGFEKRRFRL
jgi:RHS repeat-associated protein